MPINNLEYNDVLCSVISLQLLSEKKEKKTFLYLYFKICYLHDSGLWMLEGGETHRSLGFYLPCVMTTVQGVGAISRLIFIKHCD